MILGNVRRHPIRAILGAVPCSVESWAWAVGGAPAMRAPSPEAIKARVAEILAQDIYDLDTTTRYSVHLSWIIQRIRQAFQWLGEFLSEVPPFVSWLVLGVLVVVLAGILVHMLYSMYTVLRGKREAAHEVGTTPVTDAATLVRAARQLADAGNFVDASRVLFQGALTLLETKRGGTVMVGLTASEYLGMFSKPWVVENLRVFVDLINWKWYGDKRFDAADYEECRLAYASIQERLNEAG